MEPDKYQAGDCVVEHVGEIKLTDGRVFNGCILTFPVAPPDLTLSVVWDQTPVTITVRSTSNQES